MKLFNSKISATSIYFLILVTVSFVFGDKFDLTSWDSLILVAVYMTVIFGELIYNKYKNNNRYIVE